MLDNHYDNSRWAQCFELLTHLCQYSDNILLVTGPQGSGKTSMQQALLRELAADFSFCIVQASEELSAEDLTQQIEAGVFDAADKDLLLLVDDAENLSLEAIAVLLQVKNKIVLLNKLRIVLFATDALQEKVAKAIFKQDFIKNVHAIEISTMKEEASQHNYKLSPFTVGLTICFGVLFCVLAFLWPDSEEKILDNVTPQELVAQALPPAQKVPMPNDDTMSATDNTNNDLDAMAQITTSTSNQAETIVNETSTSNTERQEVVAENTATANINIPSEMPSVAAINNSSELEQLQQKLLLAQQQLEQEQQARRAIEDKYKKLIGNKRKVVAKKTVAKKPLFISKNESRILALPSKNYTLQLLCANNEAKAKAFINNNNLQSTASYYKSNIKGKDWYIVIYGNYNSKSAAQIALAKLPLALKKLHPWLREYTTIQAAIKKRG